MIGNDSQLAMISTFQGSAPATRYLSGHGGPHCFLPSYLFQQLQSADESSSKSVAWVAAKDWSTTLVPD